MVEGTQLDLNTWVPNYNGTVISRGSEEYAVITVVLGFPKPGTRNLQVLDSARYQPELSRCDFSEKTGIPKSQTVNLASQASQVEP